MNINDEVIIKHQRDLGVHTVVGIRNLDTPIDLRYKVVTEYIDITDGVNVLGYHRDSLEVVNND